VTLLLTLLTLGCAHTTKVPTFVGPAGTLDGGPTPPTAEPPPFSPPQAQRLDLPGGGQVWLIERPGLPLVSLRVIVPGGRAADPAASPGLVSMADEMLTHGAGERDAQAFAQAMDALALDLSASTDDTATVISLDTHAERLEPALDLLADALLRPIFAADELDRLRDQRKGELTVDQDDPRTVAGWVMDRVYYGEGHPLAHPAEGTLESIASLQADQLRASWEARRGATAPVFVVVGDVTADTITAELEARFSGWETAGSPAAVPPAPQPITQGPRLVLVDNPGATQTRLSVRMPAPAAADAQVEGARLGAIVLGGTFTSRLNRLLREEKGYTYGAFAGLQTARQDGVVVVGTSVQRDVTAPALQDLLGELRRIHEGLTAEELTKARGSRRTDLVEASASRSSLADLQVDLVLQGLAPDAYARQASEEATVDPAAALAAMSGSTLDHASVVVVGDLSVITGPVQAAVPGAWVVTDRLGRPLPAATK